MPMPQGWGPLGLPPVFLGNMRRRSSRSVSSRLHQVESLDYQETLCPRRTNSEHVLGRIVSRREKGY